MNEVQTIPITTPHAAAAAPSRWTRLRERLHALEALRTETEGAGSSSERRTAAEGRCDRLLKTGPLS
jgi:hypothetical protein